MKPSPSSGLAEFKWNVIGLLGKLLIDLLFRTIRIESVGYAGVAALFESRRFIMAFWHSRILLVSYLFKGMNGTILVSQSEDGELIARTLQRQGHELVRGSTTRGGLRALSQIMRKLKEKVRPAAIVPDGPQGPRFKVQPGIIVLAQKTGYPILPVSYSARRVKVFNSWDRFLLPLPFTRCRLVYGRPVTVPPNADAQEFAACRRRLEEELGRITAKADRYYGHRIS